MRVLVFCVVIKIVIATSNTDQNQYPNDENQIRRFKFNNYIPLTRITSQKDKNRFYDGLNTGMLYPRQSFTYISRPIFPYLIGRASNFYKNSLIRRTPVTFGRNINRLVFTKMPEIPFRYVNSKKIPYKFLPKALNYKVHNGSANYINGIRNLKLVQGKGNYLFLNTSKKYETELINFSTQKIKEPESGGIENSLSLSLNDDLNVLENKNKKKEIRSIAKSRSENVIGVSSENNKDNNIIFIKNLPKYVGDNISDIANMSIIENNGNKAHAMKPLSKINNSTKHSNEIENKGYILINNKQPPENTSKVIKNKVYRISLIKKEIGNQNVRHPITQNILTKNTNTIDQNHKRPYNEPLEFKIDYLSERKTPYYSHENIGPGKSNYKNKKGSPGIIIKWELHSGKENDLKDVHTKKHRVDKEPMKTENVNQNKLYKTVNLEGTDGKFLKKLIKPIEITKTHRAQVKATKILTLDNLSQIDTKQHFTYKTKNPNLSAAKEYELFLLKNNYSPPLVKKIVETNYETSDQIKFNNDKRNLIYVILNNTYLLNNNNCKNDISNDNGCNKQITFLKSVKDQSDLPRDKDYRRNKGANPYEAKNNVCVNCKRSFSTQKILNIEGGRRALNEKIESKNIQPISQDLDQIGNEMYQHKNLHDMARIGYRGIKKESTHAINRRDNTENQDDSKETSSVMTNKDKIIANILAPQDVKNDKKSIPYWLPSDAQEVYEILQQPSKEGAVNDSLDFEMPLKEEINQIVQLKKELGNENLEEIINLKINTVGIGKATNIIDKLVPSLYDVYLKNFITKILSQLRQKLSYYDSTLQQDENKNLDIHEIRKINLVSGIFENVRHVFENPDDESLYELLVSLLQYIKHSEEDFHEEVQVILDSVSRRSIYGVLKYFLVHQPTLDRVRNNLKQQPLYPQFIYFKTLENILPNIEVIISNALEIRDSDKHDINNNKETIDKLVELLIILNKIMKDVGIPETTQRFIVEESTLDVVRNLANAYVKKYEETVYVQIKKQLQDAIYNKINV